MIIRNARVFIDGKFNDVDVRFDENGITEIGKDLCGDEVIDGNGKYLYAGIIDCHNHGGWQRNFHYGEDNELGSYEDRIRYIVEKLPECGVTTVFPTLAGTDYELVKVSVKKLRELRGKYKGAEIGDFQFEGLYPSLKRYVTKEAVNPSKEHTDYLVDDDYSDVKLFHVSPDLPGSMPWCDYMVSKGVYPTVGNTEASAQDVFEAADHGLCQADHMFNGYKAMHHREAGAVAAVMYDDRIKAQLTCDGFHVDPIWVKILLKIKGINNVYGVSDMSDMSGLPEGEHIINGRRIIAKDGFIYGEDGYIASGNMTINQIMKAARDRCGLSMEELGSLYCENVAGCLNITDRGKIEVGRKSDLVLMDHDYNVMNTIINGKVFYQK
ncbi:MAG: amidohydrolase family protein [Erysipelotrichaceae bacterium]|nr:amidohydrolase family protein [Erysipelotrichaceae bacterium]